MSLFPKKVECSFKSQTESILRRDIQGSWIIKSHLLSWMAQNLKEMSRRSACYWKKDNLWFSRSMTFSESAVISSGCPSRIMGLINTMTVSLYSSGLDFDRVSEQIKTPPSQHKNTRAGTVLEGWKLYHKHKSLPCLCWMNCGIGWC